MRSRTTSEPKVTGAHRNYRNGVQQSNYAETVMSEFSSTMVDVVTPDYFSASKEGKIVNNPCTMTVTRRTTSGSGSVTQRQNASPYTVWTAYGTGTITGYYAKYGGGLPSYSAAPMPNLAEAIQLSKQECLARVDSTPFSFAEDLFEIRETLRFLRDPLATMKKMSVNYKKVADKLRRKRFGVAKHIPRIVAKDLSSLWLEYRFAVSPILRTVLSLMEAYETPRVYRPERRIARSQRIAPNQSDFQTVGKTASGRSFTYQCSAISAGSVRTGILYEVENPLVNFQYKYGLRFKDIPETLWAVMPLSFMVDRLYNVSNFFGGAVNLLDPNVKILGAWTVTKRERIQSIGVRSIVESGYTSTIVPDDIIDKTFIYERTIWEPNWQSLTPTLELRNLVNSAAKTTDLLALIIQNWRS